MIGIACNQKQASSVKEMPVNEDSLVKEAKWDLYKLNIDLTKEFKFKKFVYCKDTLRALLNYEFNIAQNVKGDTILCFWESSCLAVTNNVQRTPDFLRGDNTFWVPIEGIRYIAKQKNAIYYGAVVLESLRKDDSTFTRYIDENRDSITNQWLLDYYDNVIKKRLVKKQSK